MRIISVSDVKARIGGNLGTDHDDVLGQMIEGFSTIFANKMNHPLKKSQRVEEFEICSTELWVRANPVDVTEGVDFKIDVQTIGRNEVDTLEDTKYFLDAARGRITISSDFMPPKDSVFRVTYTGGYPEDENGILDFSADETLGAALRQAMLDQVSTHFSRRDSLDAATIAISDATEAVAHPAMLLPLVADTLESYRRYA